MNPVESLLAGISPEHVAGLVAGLLAMVANPFFGRMSDRTSSPLGMRRPWLVIGLLGGSAGTLVVALAPPTRRLPPSRGLDAPDLRFLGAPTWPVTLFADYRGPTLRRPIDAALRAPAAASNAPPATDATVPHAYASASGTSIAKIRPRNTVRVRLLRPLRRGAAAWAAPPHLQARRSQHRGAPRPRSG